METIRKIFEAIGKVIIRLMAVVVGIVAGNSIVVDVLAAIFKNLLT